MSPERIERILKSIPVLPDSAFIPVPVVAVHDNVSERTVHRNYPVVEISPGRSAVSLGFLRHRGQKQA
jgi:hypothetical protein